MSAVRNDDDRLLRCMGWVVRADFGWNLDGRRTVVAVKPLVAEAVRVRDHAHLRDRDIATATGSRPSTVRDWLNGRSAPTGSRAARLVELAEMTDRLRRVMDPEYIPIWLMKPIEVLDDEKPIELLARGDHKRVRDSSPNSSTPA